MPVSVLTLCSRVVFMIKACRWLHNWLGLILVLQIIFWFLSGLVMAVMPIEQVRGEHLRFSSTVTWHTASVAPASILKHHSANASLSLSQQLHISDQQLSASPVYLVADDDQHYRYSATTGKPVSALAEPEIRQLAVAQYLGQGQLQKVQLLQQLPQEVKSLNPPLWMVQFNDADNTHFYLDPATGLVQRVRTSGWRVFDFFWMLHIMDYQEHSNFNNPLLITTAAASLLFTLSGLVLLWQRFKPARRRERLA
ncbi:PepSY domain-containing protein [Rheinheimera gaetbuli]